ncbi:MAG: porin family protein, partial [Paramuribaculum sp.]|nr:porin family protein [Paramuribaculum sp.]
CYNYHNPVLNMNQRGITRFFAIFLVLIAFAPSGVMAEGTHKYKGEKSVGLRAGFTSRNTTATAGLYFSYRFSEYFRVSPKIDYAFQHYGTDSFAFNFDTEYPVALGTSGRVNFYPIAGINYSTFNIHYADFEDSSMRTNRFGLNLGAGLEGYATPTLRLALECKCLLIKQYTGAWVNISIGYRF